MMTSRRCVSSRFAVVAVALLAAAGCASGGRWSRADYSLSKLRQPDAQTTPLSARIYLIADNQRHELLGDGVRIYRNANSDKRTKVAIRPPQLDLFGQDLMDEALAIADGFVLHLGDACDVSNTGEFGRFAWDMRRAPQGWVMAPGNHDGFFFGNSSRKLPGLVREWDASAENYRYDGTTVASQAMQKDRFVSYYLASLVLQDAVWSGPLARALGPDVERQWSRWRGRGETVAGTDSRTFAQYWTELEELQERIYQLDEIVGGGSYHSVELPAGIGRDDRPRLRRIAWHIDRSLMWQSFVVQEVDISPAPSPGVGARDRISILVLDSSQYGVQPALENAAVSTVASTVTRGFFDVQVAGEHGNLLKSQERVALDFARSMKQEGRRWMLATHHRYGDLGRETKPRFDRLRDQGGVPVTLSAHSHTGELIWNEDNRHEGDWLEINVGSILDTPVEFRDLQVHRRGDRLAISSRRFPMEEVLRERGMVADDAVGYRPIDGDADFYLRYKGNRLSWTSFTDWSASETDFKVKRILLAAYARMFALVPADAPDQSATYWPTGPDGASLRTHEAVAAAVDTMLAVADIGDSAAMTQFLYELREFDRTRQLTDASARRLRSYRISQAIWAGRDEYRSWDEKSPSIDPDVSFVVLPSRLSASGTPAPGSASGGPATR